MRFQDREAHLVRACAVEIHMDMSQEPFCVENYRKSAGPRFRDTHFVWKFTGKKSTWTFHKNHFVRYFAGKMPDPQPTTSIKHRALTVPARTPQRDHTVWGIKKITH